MTDAPRTNMAETAMLTRGPSRTIRREELRRRVPLSDATIYEMEQKGDVPRRFNLTHSWNLVFVATVAAGRYSVLGQEAFALDTRLHPPSP